MSPLECAVNEMISNVHPIHRAMIDYAQSCRSHRLTQVGFEDSINDLASDELLFFALKSRQHVRPAIFTRIREIGDPQIVALMDKHGVDKELQHVS